MKNRHKNRQELSIFYPSNIHITNINNAIYVYGGVFNCINCIYATIHDVVVDVLYVVCTRFFKADLHRLDRH